MSIAPPAAPAAPRVRTSAPPVRRTATVRVERRRAPDAAWQGAVLAATALVLAVGGAWHEPWFDEAQAWLLARDSGPWDLLAHRLRHEGSPGLWHLLLMPFAHAGLPYRTISVVSAVIALIGCAVFVRRAPFPPVVRALLPLSYFTAFQFGVVARSYVLVAPLLWVAVLCRPARMRRPLPMAVALALLANVSVHGAIIAGCWWGLHLLDVRRVWWRLDDATRRAQIQATVVVAIAGAVVVAVVWPPADLQGGGGFHVAPAAMLGALGELWMSLPVAPVLVPTVAVGCWWLHRVRRLALFALPAGVLLAFYLVRYFSPWHAGILPLLLVAAIWAARQDGVASTRQDARAWLAACCALTVGLAAQVSWTVAALAYDRGHSYSAARATADLVRSLRSEGRTVAAMRMWTVALHPYFETSPFIDWREASGKTFYPWAFHDWPFPDDLSVLAARPDVIVFGVEVRSPRRVPCFDGYRVDRILQGAVSVGGRAWETESYVIFTRLDGPTPPRPGGASCALLAPN